MVYISIMIYNGFSSTRRKKRNVGKSDRNMFYFIGNLFLMVCDVCRNLFSGNMCAVSINSLGLTLLKAS